MRALAKYSLYLAWLFSLVGILISLYFSEVRHLEPCHLCWLQRIALFPLAIILGMAAYRNDYGIALYTLPQVVLGMIIAAYQIAIQEIPGFNPIDICGAGPNCATKHFIGIGSITIPMLSLAGFLLIALLLVMSFLVAKKKKECYPCSLESIKGP